MDKIYMCIDLKSFYASVECRERGLDPLNTNLVVADSSRTDKTICLAVSPSLKSYGIGGRARLYEVRQKVAKVNRDRLILSKRRKFRDKSYFANELNKDISLELDFIIAPPRMAYYMKYSTEIYNTYLKYVSSDDILVYSIDEVFIDITDYLSFYKCSPRELVTRMIKDVYDKTGITATAGIGTNMYLAKVAMDVVAKKCKPNEFGVRIAGLDEMTYRKKLWGYKPITAFWRVGKGIAKKLEQYGMLTMGDVARCSIKNENLLYKLFGVNAELLIDHAWGWEPSTIEIAKKYKPSTTSISVGQVLHEPYNYDMGMLIVKEMADNLALDLTKKNFVTEKLVLTVEYDICNLSNPYIMSKYTGDITSDMYGRSVPKHAHGTIDVGHKTSSANLLREKFEELYKRIVNPDLFTRKFYLVACNLSKKSEEDEVIYTQFNLFTDLDKQDEENKLNVKKEKEDMEIQKVLLDIKSKYGKNAILKGMNLEKGGTTRDRNTQIGGHHE